MPSYPSGMTVSNRALIMLSDALRQRRTQQGTLWVRRAVARPLIRAFAASQPRSHGSQAAQQDLPPWPFDSGVVRCASV